MRGNLKFPDEETNKYREVFTKKFAEMISYSDTTLAAALDNLSNGKISHAENVEFAETAEKDSDGNILTDTYLTLASGAMTGTPTAPTNSDTSCVATTEFMQEKIREVCGDVESGMTLARLIESINKNPNFAADIAHELTGKQNFSTRFDDLKNLSANVIPYFDGEKFVGAPITAQGRKILAAENLESFRGIIQAEQPEFAWDETERTHWLKIGNPTITTANARFSRALQCSAGNVIQSREAVTFGGTPFTIDVWVYCIATGDPCAVGIVTMGSDLGLGYNFFQLNSGSIAYDYFTFAGNKFSLNDITNMRFKKTRLEVCYDNGTCYLFTNGILTNTVSLGISRAARQITFGGTTCSISTFRILDGVCLHTGNFAVPSAPYKLTDKTICLLNF